MAGVISVQKHTITLAAGTGSNSATLDGTAASNTGDCIPFISSRVTTKAGLQDNVLAYAVDVYFSGSTVVVETGVSATRAMTVEVTVVEFDDTEIDVRQGTYTMAADTTTHAPSLGGTVATADTFLYHAWQITGTSTDDYDCALVRGELGTGVGDTTTATFTREDGVTTAIAGHWYTAEATSGYWTVKPVAVTIAASSASNTGTISPAITTRSKAFLIGSHSTDSPGDNSDEAAVDSEINVAGDTITATRIASPATASYHQYFVVEFKAGASDSVQYGTFAIGEGAKAANHTTDIGTPVDEANSWIHPAGATGSFVTGNMTGDGSEEMPDCFFATSFFDTGAGADTIQIDHLQNTGTDGDPYDVSWEVIEWDLSTASARRVMVIS